MADTPYRCRINLSHLAYKVIESDIVTYRVKPTMSGIINVIIKHFFDSIDSAVNKYSSEEEARFMRLLEQRNIETDSEEYRAILQIKDSIVSQYREDLIRKISSYPKDVSFLILLQNKINTMVIDECYTLKQKSSNFIKALLEDYARQTAYVREKVLFGEYYDRINDTIKINTATPNEAVAVKIEYIDVKERFSVVGKPYRFSNEDESQMPILWMIYNDREGFESYIGIPLKCICDVQRQPNINGAISKEEKRGIEKFILQSIDRELAQVEDAEYIKVSFSELGLEKYFTIAEERPRTNIESIQPNSNYRYTAIFHCPRSQARKYFLQFGEDAVITYPTDLRDEMRDFYSSAYTIYSAVSEKKADYTNKALLNDIERLKEANNREEIWDRINFDYMNRFALNKEVECVLPFYQMSADMGIAAAYGYLGDIYFESDYYESDYKKAAYYFMKGYKCISNADKLRLASLIENGLVEGQPLEKGTDIVKMILRKEHRKRDLTYKTIEGYTIHTLPYQRTPKEYPFVDDDGNPIDD